MSGRKLLSLLVKIDRKSVWLLFILMILFIISGYRLTGKYGMERIMSLEMAEYIHLTLDVVLIALFAIHSCVWIYIKVASRRRSKK